MSKNKIIDTGQFIINTSNTYDYTITDYTIPTSTSRQPISGGYNYYPTTYPSTVIGPNSSYWYSNQINLLDDYVKITILNEIKIILDNQQEELEQINEIIKLMEDAPTLKPIILNLLAKENAKLASKVEKLMCLA